MTFKDWGWRVLPRSNEGWDIGGYLEVSKLVEYDLMVCFGQSVYFHRRDWLKRIAEAWQEFGPGIYGAMASYTVRAHLVTSAFAITPSLLKEYPPVRTKAERYAFEHGDQSIWRRVAAEGYAAKLVAWTGCYDAQDWRQPPNIIFRGDQSNCLVFCNHTDKFFSYDPVSKAKWAKIADTFVG